MDYKKQIVVIISFSIFIGVLSNLIRTKSIPWVAQDIEIVSNNDELLRVVFDPQIREVDLKTAKQLHKTGVLFVDARAEEYLVNGMIPGAIANDDFEMLLEQIDFLIGYEKGFVVYCSDDDCGSSEELAYELQENGFMKILLFKGGWKSWTEAGLEIEIHE